MAWRMRMRMRVVGCEGCEMREGVIEEGCCADEYLEYIGCCAGVYRMLSRCLADAAQVLSNAQHVDVQMVTEVCR